MVTKGNVRAIYHGHLCVGQAKVTQMAGRRSQRYQMQRIYALAKHISVQVSVFKYLLFVAFDCIAGHSQRIVLLEHVGAKVYAVLG